MDLISKFWNFCHTLRHDGVDYQDYLEELTYFLFLKMASERGIRIPNDCSWNDLISTDDKNLHPKYINILEKLSRQKDILGDIFKQPIAKIRNANSLRKLLNLIDEVKWSSYDQDILGTMFEGLLEKAASESKKGAGQYFTPRPLIECIVQVMKPDPFESPNFKISDVACGTAGFIISSFEWFKTKGTIKNLSIQKKKKLFDKTYYGQELVVRPRRMAQMNLYLHSLNPMNILLGDSIYNNLNKQRYSCILTNPPFGIKGASQIPIRKDFPTTTSNKQLNFIQHVYSSLEKSGRAAIVVPDNVFFEDKASELWKHLMQYCNIHTILRLPEGTFMPYANVKANVVFFQKGTSTTDIWVYDARSNINSITKKDRPLTSKHFEEFIKCYGESPDGKSLRKELGKNGRFKKFSMSFIKQKGYKLGISWLKDEHFNYSNNLQAPELMASNAIEELELVVNELKEIINLLGSNK